METEIKNTNSKMDGNLLVPFHNTDPEGNPVYDPAIGWGALIGGLIGGVILAVVAYLIADGIWPIAGLGQLATSGNGVATFFGFVVGSGIGGLVGALTGLHRMLKSSVLYPDNP